MKPNWLKTLDGESVQQEADAQTFGDNYQQFDSLDAALDHAVTTNQPVRAWIVEEWDAGVSRYPVKVYPSRCYRFNRVTY